MLFLFVCCSHSYASVAWREVLRQPAEWYASVEARRIADNVLAYQSPNGGWAKNINMARELTPTQLENVQQQAKHAETTIDNGATHTQIRMLARVYAATGQQRYQQGVLRGVQYLLDAQYANGGWPQFYPLRKGYYSHITFNDGAMVGAMTLLRDAAFGQQEWNCLPLRMRTASQQAFQRGVQVILAMQIEVNGQPTAWCAQHDAQTLQPAKARAYELPSISGYESVGIVEMLMAIEDPSQEVQQAVESAVAWFQRSAIHGVRIETHSDLASGEKDRRLVVDPKSERMWARFYDIPTNTPMFVGRDGIVHSDYNLVERERRVGYNYLGSYARTLLARSYPRWLKRQRQRVGHELNN